MTLLAALLILAAAIAWWGLRRARTATDYFAAGRRAGAWLVGVAGTAAALSAFTFIGGPGLFVVAGVGSLWIVLSAPLTGALQCWAVGEPVVALARRRNAVTIPELIGMRFGGAPAPRAAAAAVIVIGCVASLAVQARAAAVLGEDFLQIPGVTAAALAMLATTLYTALGGMRAGLLADALQGAVMAVVAVVLAVAAIAAAGGPGAVVATLQRSRPELLGAFGATPPAQACAWFLLFCVGTCAQPHYLQKFLFLRSTSELRRLPAVLTLALALTLTVWIGVGLGGAALVAQGAVAIGQPDDLTPRTMEFIGPWAVLLAGVGVLAALMSTAASFLNLAAAALTRDLPEAAGRAPGGLGSARLATVVVAVAATALGVFSERSVALLGIAGWGFFTAALLPVMTLGWHWPRLTTRDDVAARANARAATAAILAGAGMALALELLRPMLPPGLEPGLAGAAMGVLVLVGVGSRKTRVRRLT